MLLITTLAEEALVLELQEQEEALVVQVRPVMIIHKIIMELVAQAVVLVVIRVVAVLA